MGEWANRRMGEHSTASHRLHGFKRQDLVRRLCRGSRRGKGARGPGMRGSGFRLSAFGSLPYGPCAPGRVRRLSSTARRGDSNRRAGGYLAALKDPLPCRRSGEPSPSPAGSVGLSPLTFNLSVSQGKGAKNGVVRLERRLSGRAGYGCLRCVTGPSLEPKAPSSSPCRDVARAFCRGKGPASLGHERE